MRMEPHEQGLLPFDLSPIQKRLAAFRPKQIRNFAAGLVFLALSEPWKVTDIDEHGVMLISASHKDLCRVLKIAYGLSEGSVHNARRRALEEGFVDPPTQRGNDPNVWLFDLNLVLTPAMLRDVVGLVEDQNFAVKIAPCNFAKAKIAPLQFTVQKRQNCTAIYSAIPARHIGHEHDERMNEGGRRFYRISRNDVLAIGGFGADRETALATFEEYFADACAAGLAEPDERLLMLTLFRMVARRHRLPKKNSNGSPNDERIGRPGPYLRSCWTNRASEDGIELEPDDHRYAAQLLQTRHQVPDPVPPAAEHDVERSAAIDRVAAEIADLPVREIQDRLPAGDFHAERIGRDSWQRTPEAIRTVAIAILNHNNEVRSADELAS